MAATMARKQKVQFSPEDKEELIKAFDAGMDRVSKDKSEVIERLNAGLGKDKQEIKVSSCRLTYHKPCRKLIVYWYG